MAGMTLWIWLLKWHCYDWAMCSTEAQSSEKITILGWARLWWLFWIENFPYQKRNLKLAFSALLSVQLHCVWGISDPVIVEARGCFSGKCRIPLTSYCIAGPGMTLAEDKSWFAEALGIALSVIILFSCPPGLKCFDSASQVDSSL